MKFFKIPIYALATIFVATPALVFANGELDEAEIFFELNDTDGDLGIHGFADGDEWKELEIEGPRGREMMEIDVKSRLKRQGVTELFFESAEPTFDELSPSRFFGRFPQGIYEIEVETLDGEELENEVYLSHVIPAAPEVTAVGNASPPVFDNEEELGCWEGNTNEDIVIKWNAVTMSHAERWADDDDKIALGNVGDVEVISYEIVAEVDETPYKSVSIVPAGVNAWKVPEDFVELAGTLLVENDEGGFEENDEIKFELLVRVDNGHGNPGNKSAMESCFKIGDDDDE